MKTAILTAGELRAWRPNLLLWWVGREAAYLLTIEFLFAYFQQVCGRMRASDLGGFCRGAG